MGLDGKVCKGCGEWKSFDDYYKDRSRRDGCTTRCKACAKDQQREYYKNNPEKIREYYKKNSKKIRENAREYRINNPEKQREYDRKYRKNNPEKIREAYRECYKENPERYKRYEHNRRARKANATGTHDAYDIELLQSSGFCVYCGCICEDGHIDHIYPLSGDNPDDSAFNLAYACPTCNLTKHAKNPHEWIREQGTDLNEVIARYREQHLLDPEDDTILGI